MSLLANNIQKISLSMFWLMFPGQFLYSSLLFLEVIPNFLGSGVGIFTSLVFILLIPFVIYTSFKLNQMALIYFFLFISLLLYVLSYLVLHYFFGSDVHQRADVIEQWLVLIVSWCAVYSIGYFWPEQLTKVEKSLLNISLLIMCVFVFVNLQPDNLIYALGQINWSNPQDYHLRHQGYASLMSVTGLILLAAIRNEYIFWIVSGVFLVTVFLIGARSELACVLLVFPILIYYQWLEKPVKTTLISIVVIIFLIVFAVLSWDEPSMSRQMKLLNLPESESFQYRKELSVEALQVIKQKPFTGDFAGHARVHSGVGHYAHNIISSWRQLGLFGFFLYSSLMLWPVIGTFYSLRKEPRLLQVSIWRILGVISVFMLLLALGAKSIFSSVVALGWGMYIAALKCTNTTNKELSNNLNS